MGSNLRMTSNEQVDDGIDSMHLNMIQFGLGMGLNIEKYLSNILNDSIGEPKDDSSDGEHDVMINAPKVGSSASPIGNIWESSLRDHLPSITENKNEE